MAVLNCSHVQCCQVPSHCVRGEQLAVRCIQPLHNVSSLHTDPGLARSEPAAPALQLTAPPQSSMPASANQVGVRRDRHTRPVNYTRFLRERYPVQGCLALNPHDPSQMALFDELLVKHRRGSSAGARRSRQSVAGGAKSGVAVPCCFRWKRLAEALHVLCPQLWL